MAESILNRVQRVLSSGANATVDAAERLSGESLMRQALREMDEALADTRAQREAAMRRREAAARQQQVVRGQLAALDDQARFAIDKGREDLAQAAVARQLDYEAELKRLKQDEADAVDEARRHEESLTALEARKAEMKKEHDAFRQAERRGSGAAPNSSRPGTRAEQRAERAQAALERAIAAAGGTKVGPADIDTAVKLAEADALMREATIQERLAKLKAGMPTASSAKARRARPKTA